MSGGKIVLACPCGGEVEAAHGAKCPKCGRAIEATLTIGPDTVIKAGDGPRGASVVISGGTFGPGSVVRG